MIRYSCDLCKRDLDPQHDLRYVVKMEIFAAMDTVADEDDDDDHLQEIQDILERLDDADEDQIGEEICQQLRFDLCPSAAASSSRTRWAARTSPPKSPGSLSTEPASHILLTQVWPGYSLPPPMDFDN